MTTPRHLDRDAAPGVWDLAPWAAAMLLQRSMSKLARSAPGGGDPARTGDSSWRLVRSRPRAATCAKEKLRRLRAPIDEVLNHSRALTHDARVRLAGKVADGRRVPVIAARQPRPLVHALLHDRPLSFGGDDERVQVDLETIGDGVVVDAGGQPARAHQRVRIEPARLGVARSSDGELRECRPRPPVMWIPSSCARGFRPRFSAPITDVVMPDECQSIPITLPSA